MTEQASIKFLEWLPLYNSEKPFQIFMDISGDVKDQRKTNLVWDERAVTVTDFRNNNEFELDTHGFTVRELPGFSELDDAEIIRKEFLPAVERMLKTELDDVGTVFIFDWRVSSFAHFRKANTYVGSPHSLEAALLSLPQIRSTSAI